MNSEEGLQEQNPKLYPKNRFKHLAFTPKVVLAFCQKVVADSCGEQAEQQSELLPSVNNVAIWSLRRLDNQ